MANSEMQITLEDLKNGSEAAFKTVYVSNRDKFLNYARRYNLSDDDNIDIYQDAYVIFYNNIIEGKVDQLTSSISTYLFGIGKYLILDKMRKNKKQPNANFDLSIVRDQENTMTEIDIEDHSLTPEQKLLKTHFKGLGKQCQELLTLFYYRGYTINDILNLGKYNNENVIKSQKSRCLKTLKERITASTQ